MFVPRTASLSCLGVRALRARAGSRIRRGPRPQMSGTAATADSHPLALVP